MSRCPLWGVADFGLVEVGGVGFAAGLDDPAAAGEFGEVGLDEGDVAADLGGVAGLAGGGQVALVVGVDSVGVVAQEPG